MTSSNWSPALRFGVPGLLAGLALAWVFGSGHLPAVQAQAATPAEAAGTIAFTSFTNGPSPTQLLYLIDSRSQSLAIYRVDPQDPKGTLKLEATRQYRWDLKLGEFNNQPPEVAAVEAMVGAVKQR